jgi:hypothetical protein
MFTSLEALDITLYDYIAHLFQELDTEPRLPRLPPHDLLYRQTSHPLHPCYRYHTAASRAYGDGGPKIGTPCGR